ncbi:hypothetical protein L6452_37367 [Arctium lappa]|uniref:Uncharacterized protein n=1 Tax=Arctium lappa TaxID=4217 RepID=A0ACB8Y4B4_ARCLA|nr:hypothetical protein L6452_37367 [Arctium lappa]
MKITILNLCFVLVLAVQKHVYPIKASRVEIVHPRVIPEASSIPVKREVLSIQAKPEALSIPSVDEHMSKNHIKLNSGPSPGEGHNIRPHMSIDEYVSKNYKKLNSGLLDPTHLLTSMCPRIIESLIPDRAQVKDTT